MHIKFYALTSLASLLVLPVAALPIASSPSYPSLFRRKDGWSFPVLKGKTLQLQHIPGSMFDPVEVTFGDTLVEHHAILVSATNPVIDSQARLVGISTTDHKNMRKHLLEMKLVVSEGRDSDGDEWVIVREPPGVDRKGILAADLNNVRLPFKPEETEHMFALEDPGMIPSTSDTDMESVVTPEVRTTALFAAAGSERLHLVEQFNLLHIYFEWKRPRLVKKCRWNDSDEARWQYEMKLWQESKRVYMERALDQYLFEVENGQIKSVHLAPWYAVFSEVDKKSLTPAQKEGIAKFQYLGGLPKGKEGKIPSCKCGQVLKGKRKNTSSDQEHHQLVKNMKLLAIEPPPGVEARPECCQVPKGKGKNPDSDQEHHQLVKNMKSLAIEPPPWAETGTVSSSNPQGHQQT